MSFYLVLGESLLSRLSRWNSFHEFGFHDWVLASAIASWRPVLYMTGALIISALFCSVSNTAFGYALEAILNICEDSDSSPNNMNDLHLYVDD